MTTETQGNGTLGLYELAPAYRALLEALDGLESDASEPRANVQSMLDQIEEALEYKADNVAALIRELTVSALAYRAEAERLTTLQRACERQAERLKDYLKTSLVQAGLRKVQGRRFTISLADAPPSVEVVDEAEIPDRFWRIKREVDKRAILEHWREHHVLPLGVRLTTGVSLRIR